MVDSVSDQPPPQVIGGRLVPEAEDGKVRIEKIIWLDEIVEKLWRKHRVKQHEVVEVLESRPLFRFLETGHRPGEDLYLALGQTEVGRYLTVFFIYKATRDALIISARNMARHERKQYERR